MEHNAALRSSSRRSVSRFALEAGKTSCSTNDEADCRNRRGETSKRYQLKCKDGSIGELPTGHVPDFHCKSLPSRNRDADGESNFVQKRGSMYQSSSEIRKLRDLCEGRWKVDSASDDGDFLSFEIVDSSSRPSLKETSFSGEQKGPPENCSSVQPQVSSAAVAQSSNTSEVSRDFLELSFCELRDCPDERQRADTNLLKDDQVNDFADVYLRREEPNDFCKLPAPELIQVEPIKARKTTCNDKVALNGYKRDDRDAYTSLAKSFSARATVFEVNRLSQSAEDAVNSKVRYSSLKKILDPFLKAKSLRSSPAEPVLSKKFGSPRKQSLGDFALTEEIQERADRIVPSKKEDQLLSASSSPAHLHAILRFDPNTASLLFEYSIKDVEEVLYVRTWKTGNELGCIYTFHSGIKRGNSIGRTEKGKGRSLSSILGQMQVSTYLCSEPTEDGSLKNSVATEFVLYDIARAQKGVNIEMIEDHHSKVSPEKIHDHPVYCEDELNPHLQAAAVVIQLPFSKKERARDGKAEGVDFSSDDQRKQTDHSYPGIARMICPSGTHGLPAGKGGCPSPLLERWRNDGGCDCGGWDMSCSISVFGGSYKTNWTETMTAEDSKPMALFMQGKKETLPAISIMANGEGQFLVDFHARLSALQAFGVCVALLHCSEASPSFGLDGNKHVSYSTSLKLLLEEDVRHLIKAVTSKERRTVSKQAEKPTRAVTLDPPFSPIGRV